MDTAFVPEKARTKGLKAIAKKMPPQYGPPEMIHSFTRSLVLCFYGRRLLSIVFFFFLFALGIYYKNIGDVTAWPYYNWLWTYDFGFMRRALPGEILGHFVSPPIPYIAVARIAFVIGLILVTCLAILSAAVIRRHYDNLLLWGVVLGFLLAGFGIKAIAHDIGTFEQINFIITIFVMLILRQGRLNYWRCAAAGAVAAPLLLIHEASIFFCLPIIVTFMLVRLRRLELATAAISVALFLFFPGLAALALMLHPMPNVAPDVFIRAMQARGAYDELTMVHDFGALFHPGPMLGRTFLVAFSVKYAWIGIGYTVIFVAVFAAFHKALIEYFWLSGRRTFADALIFVTPIAIPAIGLLFPGDLLRFVALLPLGLFILYCFVALNTAPVQTAPLPENCTFSIAAMAMIWASSFIVFPAIGAFPNIPDGLKCILNYYPNKTVPIYRQLCLEQRILYYRTH